MESLEMGEEQRLRGLIGRARDDEVPVLTQKLREFAVRLCADEEGRLHPQELRIEN
jgi:hypothetical protein